MPTNMRRRQSSGADDIENRIASADLLNPSDALDLLAQVADRDAEGRGRPLQQVDQNSTRKRDALPMNSYSIIFPPISDGYLSVSDMLQLLKR